MVFNPNNLPLHFCKECDRLTPHIHGVCCEVCADEADTKINAWLDELRQHPPEVYDESENAA